MSSVRYTGDFVLVDKAKELVMNLVMDVLGSMHALQNHNDSQYARRTFIRSLFSFYEGFGRVLRGVILQSDRGMNLSSEWRLLLKDEQVQVGPTGKLKLIEARFPFVNLFAATLRSWANLNGLDEEQINQEIFGDNGWNLFQQALKVRHSITHPKIGESLEIDDESLSEVFASFEWFNKICLQRLGISMDEIDQLTNWKLGS